MRLKKSISPKPDPDGQAYRTAGELAQALAQRQISSRELVDGAIARIEAVDPKINAVVVLTSTGRESRQMLLTPHSVAASSCRCSTCR